MAAGAWVAYDGWGRTVSPDAYRDVLTAPVRRGDLLITVVKDGNLESAKNLEIKCQVPGALTILEIAPDGSYVRQGDILVRLDSSLLEDAILAQQIVQARAQAARISAEKTFAAAKIAVDEYREGTFVQLLEQLEVAMTVAKQNLASAENL
ncbi:MAG TPA: biotin/lipoyl-binding protein, partial [Pirellulales bacterium]|nr:biotin/lipoyl-binding protein [Pirellulales bacterium]